MPQLPLLSGQEIIKVFSKIGYQIARQRGSHVRLSCVGRKSITIPNYPQVSRELLRKILRDAELPASEFLKLLD